MKDDLPELTAEEKAMCDRMTPDLVDRLVAFVDDYGAPMLHENDAQRIDAMAEHYYCRPNNGIGPEPAHEICKRYLWIMRTLSATKEKLKEKWIRSIRAEKALELIASMDGKTLLGSGTHEEGAAMAFNQAAEIAKAVLQAT